jgi:outer membrane protein assembly factor BamA
LPASEKDTVFIHEYKIVHKAKRVDEVDKKIEEDLYQILERRYFDDVLMNANLYRENFHCIEMRAIVIVVPNGVTSFDTKTKIKRVDLKEAKPVVEYLAYPENQAHLEACKQSLPCVDFIDGIVNVSIDTSIETMQAKSRKGLTEEEIQSLKVDDLRYELSLRGKDTKGMKKNQLQDALKKAIFG